MKKIILLLVFISIFSCKTKEEYKPKHISKVEIEDIYKDSLLSIRAIELLNDGSLVFAANNGTFGLQDVEHKKWSVSIQKYDTLNLAFRAVSHIPRFFYANSWKPSFVI